MTMGLQVEIAKATETSFLQRHVVAFGTMSLIPLTCIGLLLSYPPDYLHETAFAVPKLAFQLEQIRTRSSGEMFSKCATVTSLQIIYLAGMLMLLLPLQFFLNRKVSAENVKYIPIINSMVPSLVGLVLITGFLIDSSPFLDLIRPENGGFREGFPPNGSVVIFNSLLVALIGGLVLELALAIHIFFLKMTRAV